MKKEDMKDVVLLWQEFKKYGIKFETKMLGEPDKNEFSVRNILEGKTILGDICFDPDYQRAYLHDEHKGSEWKDWFLNTILEGGGINIISICERLGKYYLTDGVQRLTTLRSFVDDKFPIKGIIERDSDGNQTVAPVEVNNYQGLKFSQLPKEVKAKILSYKILVHTYSVETYEQELHLFDRLNKGATPVSKEHHLYVRTCGSAIGKALLDFQKTSNGKFIMNPDVKSNRGRPVNVPTRNKNYRNLADVFSVIQDYEHNVGIAGAMSALDKIKPSEVAEKIAALHKATETFRKVFCSDNPEGNVTFWKRKNTTTPDVVAFSKNIRARNIIIAAIAACDDHDFIIRNKESIIGKSAKNLDPNGEKSGSKGLFDCERKGDKSNNNVSYVSSTLFYNISISTNTTGVRKSAFDSIVKVLKGDFRV